MKLQELKLTVRVKVTDDGYFPALEVSDVLTSFNRHLHDGAYSSSLEKQGTFLHPTGAVDWELKEVQYGKREDAQDG